MERLLPILAIVGLALGALAAMLITGVGLVIVAVFGIVVGVFLLLTRSMVPVILGAMAIVALIAASLGLIGGVSGEEGGVDFGIGPGLAAALLVTGLALAAGGVFGKRWDDLQPSWVAFVGAGALGLAAILGFVFADSLGDPGEMWAIVVGLLLLVAIWPAVLLLRTATAAPAPRGDTTG